MKNFQITQTYTNEMYTNDIIWTISKWINNLDSNENKILSIIKELSPCSGRPSLLGFITYFSSYKFEDSDELIETLEIYKSILLSFSKQEDVDYHYMERASILLLKKYLEFKGGLMDANYES